MKEKSSIKTQNKPYSTWKLASLFALALSFVLLSPALANAAADLQTTGIIHSPNTPSVGEQIDFISYIRNFGDASPGTSRVELRIDAGANGSYETSLDKLIMSVSAGASRTTSFSWIAQVNGVHRVEVCADINNSIDESNETNNCLVDTFNVATSPPSANVVDIKANGFDGPVSISLGDSVFLSWTVSNASSCIATGGWSGSKSANGGSQTIANLSSSQIYTLTCNGVSDNVIVNISPTPPPSGNVPSIDIRAVPSSIDKGENSIIVWNTTNADKCVASGAWSGTRSTSGNRTARPRTTSQYVIVCSNQFGSNSNFATVGVDNDIDDEDELSFSFRASPTSISPGESTALVWATDNADNCVASGAWSGRKSSSGADVVSPDKTSTYTLSCSGAGEISTLSRTVSVNRVSTPFPPTPSSPQNFNLACVASTNRAITGQSVTFAAGETGGSFPVNFAWNGAIAGSGKVRTVNFSSAGFKNVRVTATDGAGRTRTALCSTSVITGTVIKTVTPPPVIDTPLPRFLSYGGIVLPNQDCSTCLAESKNKPLFTSIFSPETFGNLLLYIFLILLNISFLMALIYAGRKGWEYYFIPVPLNGKNGNGNGNGYDNLSSPRL